MSILVLTSDTLIGTAATGTLEYNGQFFGTDSAAARAQMQRITLSTAVASTSGTAIDFTSIPAWVKRITVMFNGVSTNGTSFVQVQLGAGSILTSGYASCGVYTGGSGAAAAGSTTGLVGAPFPLAVVVRSGTMVICAMGGNLWTMSCVQNGDSSTYAGYSGGSVSLSGTLDRLRITTVNGTDTFDAGSVNILYEG